MKIGIIGTGNMGRALGLGWAAAGHQVLFGSRDPAKARATAAEAPGARGGSFDEAAGFGEVVLHTVRDATPKDLLAEPKALAGKIVIDCNNSAILGLDAPDPEGRPGLHFTPPVPSMAERLAATMPEARVVKAFNTIPHVVAALGRDRLKPLRIPVFVAADDAAAKAAVMALAGDLGFVGMDSGTLEHARLVEAAADFIRFQILGMGLGPFTALSIVPVPQP